MKLILLYIFLFTQIIYGQKCINIKPGEWTASLQLNKQDYLPFKLSIEKIKSKTNFYIHNAEEVIKLSEYRIHQDTIIVDFPTFNSSLHFHIKNKKQIVGYWYNKNKLIKVKVPFKADFGYINRFKSINKENPTNVNGNWKVIFDYETTSPEYSVGVFKQSNTNLTGTFLTETGDYRYLEGNQNKDSLFLSCFDGSHAFLFKALVKNDSLKGVFLSGLTGVTTWIGSKDENFQLRNADSLTVIVNKEKFHFELKDLTGKPYYFPNKQTENKVVIIQIMGTWCPNCMDETRYYKELYEKYHSQGLEIISIGYEVGETFEDFSKKIKTLQERLDLKFTFLVGGSAKKSLASEQFSMLNEVISFPTSIYIGKDGVVKRVHTGFNGPGTGSYYTEYIEKTNKLIEEMLKL
jgi:thiol-disulfide isomerase/thioredoxin